MDVQTVRHVLEDVVRHGAPGVLDEHANAHEDAVEEVFLHLEQSSRSSLRKSKLNLWMCPCPADEANETSLDVVAGDGRRGSVLKQEHQVAVVEVVPLRHIEFSSLLGVVKR